MTSSSISSSESSASSSAIRLVASSFMASFASIIVLVLLIACAAQQASATVDLLNPQANLVTTSNNTAFEYYVSMPNIVGCTLFVNSNPFPDSNVQSNTMHTVQVAGMSDGNYTWNVVCSGTDSSNSSMNMSSITRSFVIDTTSPTVTIVSPQQSQSYKSIPVDFIPYDDLDQSLSCVLSWNGQMLQTVDVARNSHYMQNYTSSPGAGTLQVNCTDDAGNSAVQSRDMTYSPDYGVQLSLDKTSYGLAESVRLTINTIQGANTSIDVCPDQTGFVQCSTAILPGISYPQTITLPYLNKTGQYLIEATAVYGNQTRINRTKYNVTNTMYAEISASPSPRINSSFNLVAQAAGGISPYRIDWVLSNGTQVPNSNSVSIVHNNPGTYTVKVIVYDAMNNTAAANYTYEIRDRVQISVKAVDASTNSVISKADVSVDAGSSSYTSKTGSDGMAYMDVEPDDYKIFVAADGYKFGLLDVSVVDGANPTFTLSLERDTSKTPVITMVGPESGSTVSSQVQLQFSVQYDGTASCTAYESKNDGWFETGQTIDVKDSSPKLLPVTFDSGLHILRVGCTDKQTGKSGTSQSISVNVEAQSNDASSQDSAMLSSNPGTSDEEILLQKYLDKLDLELSAIDSKNQKDKEAIVLVGYDKLLRSAKKSLQQYVRDMSDVQFRSDLDDQAKTVERKNIMSKVESLLSNTPQDLHITDSKTFIRYLDESDVDSVSKALSKAKGMPSDSGLIAEHLLKDQQKFTVSTKVMLADYTFGGDQVKSVTIITRTFTYAKNLSENYSLYEIIPSEVSLANDIDMVTKGDVVADDIIRFGQEQTVVYTIPKKVDFMRSEEIKTVLARPYSSGDGITGFAIFGLTGSDGINFPMLVLVALFLLAYLIYYFDIVKHAHFLYYRLNKNSKLHYVRVMVGDANDQLDANNYERADMLFKEIHMTYNTLPLFARNELYDEIMELLHKMDAYYFNMVMLEFDSCMKANDLDGAISSYEKLVDVYSRLEPAQQEQLANTVSALARRLGVQQ